MSHYYNERVLILRRYLGSRVFQVIWDPGQPCDRLFKSLSRLLSIMESCLVTSSLFPFLPRFIRLFPPCVCFHWFRRFFTCYLSVASPLLPHFNSDFRTPCPFHRPSSQFASFHCLPLGPRVSRNCHECRLWFISIVTSSRILRFFTSFCRGSSNLRRSHEGIQQSYEVWAFVTLSCDAGYFSSRPWGLPRKHHKKDLEEGL